MPHVTFTNTGEQAEVPEGGSLRETVQDQGWPIPFGCENGICGTCLITLGSGKTNLNPIEEMEEQTLEAMGMEGGDHRLACQCRVRGDVEISQ